MPSPLTQHKTLPKLIPFKHVPYCMRVRWLTKWPRRACTCTSRRTTCFFACMLHTLSSPGAIHVLALDFARWVLTRFLMGSHACSRGFHTIHTWFACAWPGRVEFNQTTGRGTIWWSDGTVTRGPGCVGTSCVTCLPPLYEKGNAAAGTGGCSCAAMDCGGYSACKCATRAEEDNARDGNAVVAAASNITW